MCLMCSYVVVERSRKLPNLQMYVSCSVAEVQVCRHKKGSFNMCVCALMSIQSAT